MIRQRIGSTFALVVLLFAFVGFGYKLANDPGSLFSQLLFVAVVAGIIFLIFKFMTRNSGAGSGANSQYRKSVAQSKKLHGKRDQGARRTDFKKKTIKNATKTSSSNKVRPIRDRSKGPNLTVIEGKKGKKKKRAF
ncbi:SA1362 family protein [Exiguobacterium sp. s193]|uniref:SA1362 family protein n=1 Tax=Exiguobacterium sp. s193 TaxID=2751207 RepID=UPI001BEC8E53|nr:SA1362 family protein [Exiguobacterium sp. s193]